MYYNSGLRCLPPQKYVTPATLCCGALLMCIPRRFSLWTIKPNLGSKFWKVACRPSVTPFHPVCLTRTAFRHYLTQSHVSNGVFQESGGPEGCSKMCWWYHLWNLQEQIFIEDCSSFFSLVFKNNNNNNISSLLIESKQSILCKRCCEKIYWKRKDDSNNIYIDAKETL